MKNDQSAVMNAAVNTEDRLLSTAEVANWLGIQRCTLEKARSTRLGDFPPFIRIGRTVRYRRTDVERWLGQATFRNDGTPVS